MAHPWSSDVDEFLAYLLASGLLSADGIRDACEEFPREYQDEDSLDALSDHLIGKGLLTAWQCQKLGNGQYKGFFLAGYRLLDRLHNSDDETFYMAEDLSNGSNVELAVRPTREEPFFSFRVVRALDE